MINQASPIRPRFLEPVLNSALVDSELPADVVAEWSGGSESATRDPQTGRKTDRDCGSIGLLDVQSTGVWSEPDLDVSPMRSAGIQEYPIDEEALLFDPKTQMLFQLNETAFAVWNTCDGRTIRDLAQSLTARFDVDVETSLRHTRALVGLFKAGALLTVETTRVLEG